MGQIARWQFGKNRPDPSTNGWKFTATHPTVGHPYTKVKAAYDAQGRRISRAIWQGGTATSPTFRSSHRYLYDGWNVITEFSVPSDASTTLTRQTTLTWGLDLSNTPQGAGGVGGLLSISSIQDPQSPISYPSYDGNGNIIAWSQETSTTPVARREYDAFGNTLVSEGSWPSSYGFSTKPQDIETGLYYYGYRYYDPVTGRWPSRDPIGEYGGVNIYSFIENHSAGRWDILGREPGEDFETFEAALRAARQYLTDEGNKSLERGWGQFETLLGVNIETVFSEPYHWKDKLKEVEQSDFATYKNGAINDKITYDALIGKEVAAAVYCYDGATKKEYSYNYYSGTMPSKAEYAKMPAMLGRIPRAEAKKLLSQRKHKNRSINAPINHLLHTHLLAKLILPSHQGVRARTITPPVGLSDSDRAAAEDDKVKIYAIERDGQTYYRDYRN